MSIVKSNKNVPVYCPPMLHTQVIAVVTSFKVAQVVKLHFICPDPYNKCSEAIYK